MTFAPPALAPLALLRRSRAGRAALAPLALAALLTGLGAGAAPAFDIKAMTPEENAAFGDAVRGYLLDNPEVLMEVVSALESKQADAQAEGDASLVTANAKAIYEDGYSWVGGNPEGNLTLVEFLDYRCGYCRQAHSEILDLVKSDGNIRYVVKEFPILGPDSVTASRFAIATLQVAGPEAYEKVNDAFYTSYRGAMTPPRLEEFANGLGLDGKAILAAMDTPAVTSVIEENHRLADRLQIQGTPTFVLGDTMVRGYLPLDGMRKVVADERG